MIQISEAEINKAASNILSETYTIKEKHKNYRKGSRSDFNFFEGIANSGKGADKTTYELYHSNFIAYLLNPQASHDCDSLFLDNFFTYIKTTKNFSIENFNTKDIKIEVERERKTDKERSIDITIENKGKWMIFIENKVGSGELSKQFSDYLEYCETMYPSAWLGVYLTKNGITPTSIEGIAEGKKKSVICLSYTDIIAWLKLCMPDLIRYPHITGALSQYIMVVDKIINPLTTEEMEELIKLIIDKPANINAATAIHELLNSGKMHEGIMRKFVDSLKPDLAKIGIEPSLLWNGVNNEYTELNFKVHGWKNHKILYSPVEGDTGKGIYRIDNQPCSTVAEKESTYAIFVSDIRGKLKDINIWEKASEFPEQGYGNWVWISLWKDYDNTDWSIFNDGNLKEKVVNEVLKLVEVLKDVSGL